MQDDKVSLVEMGPRDGLQNEANTLPLIQRLELIARLVESGLQRIEVGAFVSPRRVPQMADSAELLIPVSITTSCGPPISTKCSTLSRRTRTSRRILSSS